MRRQIRKWLLDIDLSIRSIHEYLGDERDFFAYQQNKMLRRAIEREFEIIGEAVGRILHKNPEIPIDSASKIKSLRNHIIHAYDSVSNEIIWGIIVKNLPGLQNEVRLLLDGQYSEEEE